MKTVAISAAHIALSNGMAVTLQDPGLDAAMALETGIWGLPWIDDIGITPPSDLKMQAAGSVAALTNPVQPIIIHDRKLVSTMHGALEVLDYVRMAHGACLLSDEVGPANQLLSRGDVHSRACGAGVDRYQDGHQCRQSTEQKKRASFHHCFLFLTW
jgi:hypothetical protein